MLHDHHHFLILLGFLVQDHLSITLGIQPLLHPGRITDHVVNFVERLVTLQHIVGTCMYMLIPLLSKPIYLNFHLQQIKIVWIFHSWHSILSILYPDIGVSHHISNDPSVFNDKKSYHDTKKVQLGNGTSMHISHIGFAYYISPHTHAKLVLNNLLHVLEINKDLISVSKLAHGNNVYFWILS